MRKATIACLLLTTTWKIANAQRVKPCFTGPPSCDRNGLEGVELAEYAMGLPHRKMCNHLVKEYFPSLQVFESVNYLFEGYTFNVTDFDLHTEWEKLAAIPADTHYCDKARKAMPFCDLCNFPTFVDCPFESHPPSCDDYQSFQPSQGESFLRREATCEYIQYALVANAKVLAFDNFDIGNVSHHTPQLWATTAGNWFPGQCDMVRRAYPHCFWCDSSAPHGVALDRLCDQEAVSSADDVDVEDTDQICTALQGVVSAESYKNFFNYKHFDTVRTWDLLKPAQQVVHKKCPELCNSCFNETHPPKCSNNPDELPSETDDIIFAASDLSTMLHASSVRTDRSKHLDALRGIRASHPSCKLYRQVYKHGYWCDDIREDLGEDFFRTFFCREKGTLTFPGAPTAAESTYGYNGTNREEFEKYCSRVQDLHAKSLYSAVTIDLVRGHSLYGRWCNCTPTKDMTMPQDYLGATTTAKKRTLVWLSRTSAILSLMGAFLVLYDVKKATKNGVKVYHQLVTGIVMFDLVTAVAWGFASHPISDQEGYHIVGAQGSDASCRVQGFFIQLGFTSVFYNVSLASYYYLVVAKGWRETRLRKIALLLHFPPVVLGLGLAFAALPFYSGFDYACHLTPYSDGKKEASGELWHVLLFAVCPIALAVLFVSLVMVWMYSAVHAQSQAAQRWMSGQSTKMEKLVFWQALSYSLSFYVTWPVVLMVYATGRDFEKEAYALAVLVSFVAPLQGFNNCLVYFRLCITSLVKEFSIATVLISILGFRRGARDSSSNQVARRTGQRNLRNDPSVEIAADDEKAKEPAVQPDDVELTIRSKPDEGACGDEEKTPYEDEQWRNEGL